MIAITIPGEMRGKGRPRFSARGGFARAYTDAKTASAETWVKACAVEAMAGREMLTEAIEMVVAITVGIPPSWTKKKSRDAAIGAVRPTGKPDVDNCVKLLADALNGIVWRDDSQIVALTVTKAYGTQPRTDVVVKVR